ncbi:MAG: Stp1/IreP family PP2C-type Ser/Thr phosphatase [Bacillota bacterium]|nr:Stp1/IreP family PP2C-type Ser/Thr phosphatase [Bacillota bacterium]
MMGMLSDTGNYRELNEDFVGCFEENEKRVYIVADGMGGHNAGEVASKIAVQKTLEYINSNFSSYSSKIDYLIIDAIKNSNRTIFELSQQDISLRGMGTTITACLAYNKKLLVANVGDSSCYILKKDGLHKVTKDHSLVQQLLDIGSITEEEALIHPNKNIITRALGTDIDVDVDIFILDLTDIEKIILCTDGLSNNVNKKEMCDILLNYDNNEACVKMVELSKQKGSKDNISVIVFEGECKNDRNFIRK